MTKTKKKIKGMFWHVHHDELCEYVWDAQERIDYIKENKPKNEIKTRLNLFKKVKGKLPKEFVEAWKKYDEAREKYVEAGKKYNEAWKKYNEAWKKYNEAWKKYNEAREKYNEAGKKSDEAREKYDEAREKYVEAGEKYKLEIEKLHAKECGCKYWNSEKGELEFE
jgi:chromosome segregation ATPase